MHLSIPTDPCREAFQRRKQSMYRNRKKYIKPVGWILFLLCFYAAASFTGCDPALFVSRSSHLSDLAADMMRFGSLLFSKDPAAALLHDSDVRYWYRNRIRSGTDRFPFGAVSLHFPSWARRLLRLLIQILRSFPALILALAATFLFGLGTFAGTFAITLYTFAIMTKLTYEDAEHTDTAPYQALISMGCARFPAFIHAVLPEILPAFLTNALYLFETNVRHSSILGYVGAGGIGLILNEKISWREFHKVGTILLLLFLTVCVIESANRYFTAVIHSGQIAELFSGRKDLSKKTRISGRMILFGFAVLFLFCLATQTPPDFSRTSAAALKSMAAGLTHPDWSFFSPQRKTGSAICFLRPSALPLSEQPSVLSLPHPLPFSTQDALSLLRPLFSLT